MPARRVPRARERHPRHVSSGAPLPKASPTDLRPFCVTATSHLVSANDRPRKVPPSAHVLTQIAVLARRLLAFSYVSHPHACPSPASDQPHHAKCRFRCAATCPDRSHPPTPLPIRPMQAVPPGAPPLPELRERLTKVIDNFDRALFEHFSNIFSKSTEAYLKLCC